MTNFFLFLFLISIHLLTSQEHSLSSRITEYTRGKKESVSLSEKEALTKAAYQYLTILNKIGAAEDGCQSEEILLLCAKDCKKIRNGKLLFKGREFFAAQLDAGKNWLGTWSIDACEVLIASEECSAIIRYELSTEKEGDLIIIAILNFDSNYLISEINEVHNLLER